MANTQTLSPYGTVRLWPFPPNWSSPVVDTIEYMTEVLVSRNGKEQRIAYREVPRRSREFSILESTADFRTFFAQMAAFQGDVYVIPDVVRSVNVTAGLAGGTADDTITVDAAADWLVAGYPVVLSYNKTYGLYLIDSVDSVGTGITFTTAEQEVWPAGTRVHPGLVSYLTDALSTNERTNNTIEAGLRFDVIPLSEPDVTLQAAAVTFNDREVFLTKPNWKNQPQMDFIWPNETVDYSYGAIARFNPMNFSTRMSQWTYTSMSRAEAVAFEHFFRRHYGQQREFYLPTWEDNLPPVQALTTAGTTLEVSGTEVYEAFGNSTVYKALVVVLNDGTYIYRLVDSIIENSGNSQVIVTAAWGQDVALEDIRMVSWMPICRFASDGLTTKWLTNAVAEIQVTQQTLEEVTLETGDLL